MNIFTHFFYRVGFTWRCDHGTSMLHSSAFISYARDSNTTLWLCYSVLIFLVIFFFITCLSERSVIYEDTPTPCLESWLAFFSPFFLGGGEKKKVPPPPLSNYFRAGAASWPVSNYKTPPLNKSCVHHRYTEWKTKQNHFSANRM